VANQTSKSANDLTTSSIAESIKSAPKVLQWQTAYWSLVVLGLNAMTQPSGFDWHLVFTALSPARSSPIMCIADIVVMIVWICAGLRHRMGIRRSLGLAAYYTTVDPVPFSTKARLKSGNRVFGVLFFLLVPLPQFVKLCGMKGIPITQTIGAIYMTVYLLSALVSLYLKPGSTVGSKLVSEEDPDGLAISEIRRLRRIAGKFYALASTLHIIIKIILIIALAIDVMNPGAGYPAGLITIVLLATFGCVKGRREQSAKLKSFSYLVLIFNIVFGLLQAKATKEGGEGMILGKPRAAVARSIFYLYQCLGSGLLLGAMIIVVAILFSILIIYLASTANSLLYPVDSSQWQTGTWASRDLGEAIPMGIMAASEDPSSSIDKVDQSLPVEDFDFDEWLTEKHRTVGIIGESPANSRPFGLSPGSWIAISDAKSRGDPYWTAFFGGPATSPPPGTIYLSAAQIELVSLRHQYEVNDADEAINFGRSDELELSIAVINLIIGLLFYMIKYDAKDTIKPNWTEWIG
jgi:hypothetical protein